MRSASSRCPEHERQQDRRRGSARERGYTSRWDAYSRRYLQRHRLCGQRDAGLPNTEDSRCRALGLVRVARVVDHVTPHHGERDPLFWDPTNHQALCFTCHNRKTATKDGGFGR